MDDLARLSEGDVMGMMIEAQNDGEEYMPVATQEDLDKF